MGKKVVTLKNKAGDEMYPQALVTEIYEEGGGRWTPPEPLPAVQTDGSWRYRVYGDGTFEAWYSATAQTLTINNASGNVYRSGLQSLTLPAGLTSLGTVTLLHASVTAAHGNYPTWAALAGFGDGRVDYYAMSGGSRSTTGTHLVTCHVCGVVG